jgi:hypothetical protein
MDWRKKKYVTVGAETDYQNWTHKQLNFYIFTYMCAISGCKWMPYTISDEG